MRVDRFPFLVIAGLLIVAPFRLVPAGEPDSAGSDEGSREHDTTVSRLVSQVDPLSDPGWPTEAFEAQAKAVLKRLGEILSAGSPRKRGLATVFAEGARATALRPRSLAAQDVSPGVALLRLPQEGAEPGSSGPVLPVLRDLLRPFRRVSAPRFTFKIIGVQPRDKITQTTVRYEGAGASAEGLIQHTGLWTVDWSTSDAAEGPRITTIRDAALDEITARSVWFEDRTAGVVPQSDPEKDVLQRGGDYWHGRIDGLGEPNLMGHQGLAVGDVDGDGLEDLYVAMGTGLPNRLLRQRPDGTLVDIAAAAGVDWLDDTKGVLFADTDNDGDQDLLLAMGPVIVLSKNDGKGTFDRVLGLRAPTPAPFYSISVADYDLDGDLDIYGTRYVKVQYGISVPLPFHDATNGPTNHLLRNEGSDRFVDATAESGLDENNTRFSLVGAWADYDDDGDPDLYVANDFGRNSLYRNEGGRFRDVAAQAGAEDQAAGMGASWADADGDGDLDLYITNMFSAAGKRVAYQSRFHANSSAETRRQVQRHSLGNTLLVNQGDGTFRDQSDLAGVRMGRWGWGARFVDLDNDGNEDIVVPNGFVSGALEDDL